MANDEKGRSSPVFLVMMALVGLYTVPWLGLTGVGGSKPGSSPAQDAAKGQAKSAASTPVGDAALGTPDMSRLAPLAKLISDGRSGPPQDRPQLIDQLRQAGYELPSSLIALVPDPDRTTNGYQFDLSLDALQRAFESWDYILERYRFPWGEREAGSRVAFEARLGGRPWVGGSVGTRTGASGEDEPGLLVFRSKTKELLLVFLVLETPTQGLNKAQLTGALDEVDALETVCRQAEVPRGPPRFASPHRIYLLGPNFTGTQRSLGLVLRGWMGALPNWPDRQVFWPDRQIFVTAGGASDVDASSVGVESPKILIWPLFDVPPVYYWPHKIDFRATRNRRRDVLEAMVRFLGAPKGLLGGGSPRIAILAESNTGFGQALERSTLSEKQNQNRPLWDLYDFPLHISRIRGAYERQGLIGDAASQLFRSAGRLGSPTEEPGQPRDLLPSQTPDLSTRHDELALIQILTALSRSRYDAVGIFATNPYDAIFLARMVRRFDPNLLIFTTQADLLLTQPQSIGDLRGMLVGSTYPLYPHNQTWSYPNDYPERTYFFSESAQALYNAADLTMGALQDSPKSSRPIDYGMPFHPDEGRSGTSLRPPIWISIVGNRGLYPLHVERARTARPPFDRDHAGTESSLPKPDNVSSFTPPTGQAPTLDERRQWFRPWYHWSWTLAELALLAVLLAMLIATLVPGWVRRKGLDFEPDGPLVAVTALIVLGAVSWPMLAPGPVGPEFDLELGAMLAYGGAVLALTNLVVVIGMRMRRLVRTVAIGIVKAVGLGNPRVADGLNRQIGQFWQFTTLLAGGLALSTGLLIFIRLTWESHPPGPDTWLLRERIVTATSGVSPLFPMVFVAVAWGAWFYAQARRRGLNAVQSALPVTDLFAEPLRPKGLDQSFVDPLASFYARLARLGRTFSDPWKLPLGLWLLPLGMVFPLIGYVWPMYAKSPANPVVFGWSWAFWALFWVAALLLTFQTFVLAWTWNGLSFLLRDAARLPLARAFDRMPTRLGRWVFEAPRPGWRSALVLEQCRTVAAPCSNKGWLGVMAVALCGSDDASLTEQLKALSTAPEDLQKALKDPDNCPGPDLPLIAVLARAWKGLPVTFTHGDPAAEGKRADDWPGLLAPAPAADEATVKRLAADHARVVAWLVMAEDYLALRLLHWVGRAQAQVWVMVRAVVVGVLGLLLAVNSYPFRDQSGVGSVLAVLVTLVAVAVLRVVVGLNRDELISRVTNSVPGRLKLDRDLLSNLLTYIVPLIGLLGALSYDVSDLLRSWFDPLFRSPM